LLSWTPWNTEWDPQSLASSFGMMELSYPNPAIDWVVDFGASSHTTPYPGNIHSSHPPSIIVGNGFVLHVTLVGDSVLPGPFYLNEILVAPNLVQNLLSICRIITDNSCSTEFDPFSLSVKDLVTRSVIARYDSPPGPYTIPLQAFATSAPATLSYTLVAAAFPSTWHRRLRHPDSDVLSKLSRTSVITCPRASDLSLCHAC
jgi:hypothetical protein